MSQILPTKLVFQYYQCSSRKWKGTGTPKSRRRGGRVWGGGIPLPSGGAVWKGGGAPSPDFFFDFLSGNGAFWCIQGACFNVSIRRVKQTKSSFVCQLPIGQLSHMADLSSVISYTQTHISESAVRRTCSLYYGHSRHTRTCYHLSLCTTFMHFISRDSTPFH